MAARNITVAGASFSAVPAVELPVTGGGTATFTEVTDTTATAADVLATSYFYTAAGERTAGTLSTMTGATSSAAGASGLVPAPAAGDEDSHLRGDGTWEALETFTTAEIDAMFA